MTDGEAAARARLEALFSTFDRLTPDDLARVGLRRADDEELEELLDAVDAAAGSVGRQRLVDEARERAREAVLRRYADGTLHATWVALNWGISQGTTEDRVAIVEALADAAAVAVVEDVLDPEVAAALALDAQQVLGLATGSASDGALARALSDPEDPDLGPSAIGRWIKVGAAATMVGWAAVGLGAWVFGLPGAIVAFLAGAAAVVLTATRARRRPAT
jgi:hypothetical protein